MCCLISQNCLTCLKTDRGLSNVQRLDQVLVARQLVPSRTAAARHIQAGEVNVNGETVTKPATKVSDQDEVGLTIVGPQYASRAGHKLAGAFDRFSSIAVAGARCLDAGASTGGFTDVLLQRDAQQVVAVDVGRDQLVQRLRNDPRVDVHEGVNIRYLAPDDIAGPVDIVVSDLSFISLKLVMLSLVAVCKPGAQLVLMIKPQFEIGRERLPKSGVVVNPQQRREAVMNVIEEALECGLTPRGVAASRLPGQDGNREYFFWASLKADGESVDEVTEAAQWLDTQHVEWADALPSSYPHRV